MLHAGLLGVGPFDFGPPVDAERAGRSSGASGRRAGKRSSPARERRRHRASASGMTARSRPSSGVNDTGAAPLE